MENRRAGCVTLLETHLYDFEEVMLTFKISIFLEKYLENRKK